MRIRFEQAGGFAAPAMNRQLEIDTATLPPGDAQEVSGRVAAIGSLDTASAGPRRASPDAMSYRITIEDENDRRVLTFSDADIPAAAAPLVEWLRARLA